MIKIIVNFNDVDRRLDKFLLKYFDTSSKSLIYRLIRTNKIKVNKKKPKIDYHLKLYDEINIYYDLNETKNETNDHFWFLNSKIKLDIIYEDNNIVLINKPINIASQIIDDNSKDSIQKAFLKYLYETNQYTPKTESVFLPSICNRLDTNTSGIIIAAKNYKSLEAMNKLIKDHDVIKKYKCLVIGNIYPDKATLTAYHKKDASKNQVYISSVPKPGFKEIITKYDKEWSNNKYSLLDVELVTGRTHQIRAQFAHIGYALVGETKYKSKETNVDSRFKQQALVSYYVKFNVKDKDNYLYYLNQKSFKINDIWFLELLKSFNEK